MVEPLNLKWIVVILLVNCLFTRTDQEIMHYSNRSKRDPLLFCDGV